jgi:hypothetical protein
MTKYGMPGVYTHAFMDGWSPGYLGSVSYNHNGLMKMYETQSGRDLDSARVAEILNPRPKVDSARPIRQQEQPPPRHRDDGPAARARPRWVGPRVVPRHSDA